MYLRDRVALLSCDRMVRLRRDKEIDVKVPVFMMVAVAAIVFAAPMANAREDKNQLGDPSQGRQEGPDGEDEDEDDDHVEEGHDSASPADIDVPPFTGTPAVAPATDWCATEMVDCSDQQLCDIWGQNCSTAGGDQTAQQPAAPVSTSAAAGSSVSASFTTEAPSSAPASDGSSSDGSIDDMYADC